MKSKFCVVGSPVEHSLSPLIHQAAYSHLGLDFQYERHEVSSGGLTSFVEAESFSGLSVTMPLKEEAFSFANLHSELAAVTGVANTLVQDGSGWVAHNTDVFGISQSIKSAEVKTQIVVLGSGATARSALVSVSNLFPTVEVVVLARNAESAMELVDFSRAFTSNVSLGATSIEALLGADLVVSTVPASGFDNLWAEVATSRVKPSGLLFDVAYNPWPSVAAAVWGIRSISGLEMLIWQAVQQVKLFAESQNESSEFDFDAIYGVMKKAVTESS